MAPTHHNPSHSHYHKDHYDIGVDPVSGVEEIELQEGETICDKCEGTGMNSDNNMVYFPNVCQKCQGEKKLDWISRATGVAPKEEPYSMFNNGTSGYSLASSSGGYHGPSHNHTINSPNLTSSKISISADQLEINGEPLNEYIAAILAEELSKKIDEEIIEAYIAQKEQTNKKRRKLFDNRIFSKLLFFRNFKQRVKNKKD